jgi:hypothetical protein
MTDYDNVLARQKELYDLLIRIRTGAIRRSSELEPLRGYVYKRVYWLCRDDREDVLSRMLVSIVNGEFEPVEHQTYKYLKQRLINAKVEGGYVESGRYKAGRICTVQLRDDGPGYVDGWYENVEVKAEIEMELERLIG